MRPLSFIDGGNIDLYYLGIHNKTATYANESGKESRQTGSILQVERKFQPDLLVMATHGRKGLARLFVGSIAEAVLRKADCPVLTIREERL